MTDDATQGHAAARTRRALAAILVLLVLLLITATLFLLRIVQPIGEIATPAETGGLEWVRSIYGWGPELDEQLMTPSDVAIGPDGTIWVTDQARSRVLGFDPDGVLTRTLYLGERAEAEEALVFPSSVAADEAGLVYIADPAADRVVVMTPENEIVREIYVPRPASVAAQGDRIAVGSQAGFIILSREGTVIEVLGSRGTGPDQFDTVRGVAVAEDGTIFAVDQYNNRVSAYDADGDRLWIVQTGNPGNQVEIAGPESIVVTTTAEAALQMPGRITIDGRGRLVIVDPFDFSLTVLDPADGSLIAKYGAIGTAEGEFSYPSGVSYDHRRDWFAVADTANSRVQIVRIPGSGALVAPLTRTLSGPLRACCLPLFLLLVALALAVAARIRQRRQTELSSAG